MEKYISAKSIRNFLEKNMTFLSPNVKKNSNCEINFRNFQKRTWKFPSLKLKKKKKIFYHSIFLDNNLDIS